MQTSHTKLEEMKFDPRPGRLRLLLVGIVFSFLTAGFIHETKSRLEFTTITDPRFLVETIFIALLLLSGAGFLVSYLLLQHRLSFTEKGIHRRTLWPPRFIAWSNVRRAQISNFKGYFALELSVSKRRWICIPLLEYRRSASLMTEIRKRLPVQVVMSEQDLARLRDE